MAPTRTDATRSRRSTLTGLGGGESVKSIPPEGNNTMTDQGLTDPLPGEIWQDAEGTLMCRSSTRRWWVFGNHQTVDPLHPLIVQPLARVFDRRGEFVGDRIHYPTSVLEAIALEDEQGKP